MDIAPYRFIKIDDSTDAFVLNEGRKRFNRIYHLFLPLLLLAFSVFFLFILNKRGTPGWYNWFPFLFGILGVLILFSVHTVEARFSNDKIQLVKRNVFRKWIVKLPVADQQHLATSNVRAKGGGNYIYAIDKKNNKMILLVVPYWDMKQAKGEFIAQAISDKTGLPVQKL
jgi:hypothetical protein